MEPIHRRVAGLDVHRMKHVITVLIEGEDGSMATTLSRTDTGAGACEVLLATSAHIVEAK